MSSYHNYRLISLHSSLFMLRVSDCIFVCVEGKELQSFREIEMSVSVIKKKMPQASLGLN